MKTHCRMRPLWLAFGGPPDQYRPIQFFTAKAAMQLWIQSESMELFMLLATIRRVCLFSILAIIGQGMLAQEQQTSAGVEPLSTVNFKCWTTGAGQSYYRVCVSRHGNMTELKSPTGIEYVRVGDIGEGYVACAGTTSGGPATAYYDAGSQESGWAEPYSVTAAPVISRKTSDGKLELVQKYTVDSVERDFTITMTLYNRSTGPLYNVRLDRYADIDVSSTQTSDIFHRSPRSVFATDEVNVTKLVVMTELTAADLTTAIHSWSGWQRPACNQVSVASPTSGADWVGRISYNFGTIAKGASKTVKLQYRLQ